MSKPFDHSKVPAFIVFTHNNAIRAAFQIVVKMYGFEASIIDISDTFSFGNCPVGDNGPYNGGLYWGYGSEGNEARLREQHPGVKIFHLNTQMGKFVQFLEDSQKITEIFVPFPGGSPSRGAKVTKTKIEFVVEDRTNPTIYVTMENWRLIQDAINKLD